MPLRPAAGKHEPASPPRQDQQHTHPYTHAANGSQGGSSDSSREEDSAIPFPAAGVAFRPGAERSRGAPMEEPTGNTVVIRIGIPDLQQTVRDASGESGKDVEAASPPFSGWTLFIALKLLM